MPGCSRPPVISASSRNRSRLSGWSAWRSWISLRATWRFSSPSTGDEDGAEAPLGVRPEDAEPRGPAAPSRNAPSAPIRLGRRGAGRWSTGRARRRDRRRRRPRLAWTSVSGTCSSASRAVPSGAERREAPLRVAAVLLDVAVDQRLEQGPARRVQGAALDEDLAERPVLLQGPGVHRRDQGVAGDEVHLQRQDAEEEVAVCRRGGHGRGPRWPGFRRGTHAHAFYRSVG